MFSPRPKPVAHPNDPEQKKKRQTLERAKANHLSKQLQMRLQYAKLKVEHGWQRQNLNEVENLYFHLRQRPHPATHPSAPAPPPSPTPSAAAPDRAVPSPPANGGSAPGSVSPPSEPAPEPIAPPSAHRPPSALDLSDPSLLARLAQLQSQAQTPSHSRQPSSPSAAHPVQPSTSHPQSSFYTPLLGTSTPASTPHNATVPSQPPTAPAPIPTTPIPTLGSVAPSALTYDSFWSTHASSSGATRALYRAHTGFTTSATPAGNVAMLTPGGHVAIMTADGVYVGGASSRNG